MLHVIEASRMMIVEDMVLVVVTNRVVGVGQAINSVPSRREGDRDWRCNKGKDCRSGDPDRHSK
jgi:hypothetical protein